jgi:hypothetical protein
MTSETRNQNSLATVSAEADVIVKPEGPQDSFERLELHAASIRELKH